MLLLVVTAAFWALYSVLVRKFMHGYSVRLAFGAVSLYAAPFLLALMFTVGNWKPVLHLDAWRWFLIWGSAIAGIALGHVLFYRAIHALGPIASEGSLLLIPFVTSVLAFFTLDERLGCLQWAGGLVLVFGCLFLVLAKVRSERRVELAAPVD
jgi:drug/metabolite transporter (DMT)-like permease